MNQNDFDELINVVAASLLSNVGLSQPLYCPQIETEEDADALSHVLPLVYLWNENQSNGSCTISVNGRIVAETLECFIPRSAPDFCEIRDHIMATINRLVIPSISKACQGTGLFPSVAFSADVYRDICAQSLTGTD